MIFWFVPNGSNALLSRTSRDSVVFSTSVRVVVVQMIIVVAMGRIEWQRCPLELRRLLLILFFLLGRFSASLVQSISFTHVCCSQIGVFNNDCHRVRYIKWRTVCCILSLRSCRYVSFVVMWIFYSRQRIGSRDYCCFLQCYSLRLLLFLCVSIV
jgi:hypothetical protein